MSILPKFDNEEATEESVLSEEEIDAGRKTQIESLSHHITKLNRETEPLVNSNAQITNTSEFFKGQTTRKSSDISLCSLPVQEVYGASSSSNVCFCFVCSSQV